MKQLILHLCLMSVPIFAIAQAQDFRPLKQQEEIRQIQQTLLEMPPLPPLPPIPVMPPMPQTIPNLLDRCHTFHNLSENPIFTEFEWQFGFNHSFETAENAFSWNFIMQDLEELERLEFPEKQSNKFLEMLPFYHFFKS
ncbi:MAG: hypothetical protein KBF32_10835 [Chitinophagales bacterium]|nr:hypothetical protein [Chitinophagaceae bacterium]MBP9883892.1 hypothetical protein [Chitinophagales bacterium]